MLVSSYMRHSVRVQATAVAYHKRSNNGTVQWHCLPAVSHPLHRHHGGGTWSQSQPKQEEVLIPAGHESTYRQECQREEKQCRSETLKRHLEKGEAKKQEVLMHSCSYISQCTREIKSTLQPMDEVVWGFKVFADNAAIYAAYILATLEWG